MAEEVINNLAIPQAIPKSKNNIVINDELEQFVWDIFEKPFIKNTKLL